jgi:hypothetical protein
MAWGRSDEGGIPPVAVGHERHRVEGVKEGFEGQLQGVLGLPVHVNVRSLRLELVVGQLYPPSFLELRRTPDIYVVPQYTSARRRDCGRVD